jgi:hypothetical protein
MAARAEEEEEEEEEEDGARRARLTRSGVSVVTSERSSWRARGQRAKDGGASRQLQP